MCKISINDTLRLYCTFLGGGGGGGGGGKRCRNLTTFHLGEKICRPLYVRYRNNPTINIVLINY
jgi:hypothetical protein